MYCSRCYTHNGYHCSWHHYFFNHYLWSIVLLLLLCSGQRRSIHSELRIFDPAMCHPSGWNPWFFSGDFWLLDMDYIVKKNSTIILRVPKNRKIPDVTNDLSHKCAIHQF
jgi:hypothetical protein